MALGKHKKAVKKPEFRPLPDVDTAKEKKSNANFTPQQREVIKDHISKLYLEGYSINNMARYMTEKVGLKISNSTASFYTKQILKEWHDSRVNDIDMRITAELIRLDKVEQEAWSAWERSKFDKMKYTKKYNDLYGAEDITETTESVGDVKFLELARQCILDRMQWLSKGTFAPDEANIFNIQNNTVFIGVVDRKRPQDATNAIEAQIISTDGPQQ